MINDKQDSTGHNKIASRRKISTHNAYEMREVTVKCLSCTSNVVSSQRDLCVIVVFPSPDFNLDVASLGYYENVISSTLKAFFKLLPDPLISDEVASKILAVNCECVVLYCDAKIQKIMCALSLSPTSLSLPPCPSP